MLGIEEQSAADTGGMADRRAQIAARWAQIAALEAREQQVLAWLADVRAQRLQILAEMRAESLPQAPEPFLEAAALAARWKAEGLPDPPASAEALLHRCRRGTRWFELRKLGERHKVGRTLRWRWSEVLGLFERSDRCTG